jgi:hypothetical protein
MTDSGDFKHRNSTVRGEFYYPPGYEPAEYDGVISSWMTGAWGLTRLSAPKHVTAVYVACSTGRTSKHIYYDETTGFYWPRPDKDYKNLKSAPQPSYFKK